MKNLKLIATIYPTHLIFKATFEYDPLLLDFVNNGYFNWSDSAETRV